MPKISSDKHCKFQNDLLKSKFITDIKNVVKNKLSEIDIMQFRTSRELTLIVCNVIWNACEDLRIKEDDFDKKQLVVDILTPILQLSPSEIDSLKNQIDYVVNHNQIVIIKNSTKLIKGAWKLVKKKLL